MNKKLAISVPILITIIISVIITTIMMRKPEELSSPNSSPEINQSIDNGEIAMEKVYINIGNKKLEDNTTVSALAKMLPLNLSMSDLNGNEKYTYLSEPLPTNTYSPKRIEAGDVMLFGNNCLVIFYESFDTSYSYSKIGHISNLPELGDGSITVNLNTE